MATGRATIRLNRRTNQAFMEPMVVQERLAGVPPVVGGGGTTPELADYLRRLNRRGITEGTNFDVPTEVSNYAWRDTRYWNNTTGAPNYPVVWPTAGLMQWVGGSHPDVGLLLPGYSGAMKHVRPHDVGASFVQWVRKYDRTWNNTPNAGYGPGDEFWRHFRMYTDTYLCESQWDNHNAQGQVTGGGWKFVDDSCYAASNTAFEIVGNETIYYGHIAYYHQNGNGYPPFSIYMTPPGNEVSQQSVLRRYPYQHPTGQDPNTGTTTGGQFSEQNRKRYGPIHLNESVFGPPAGPGITSPMRADPISGGVYFLRDCADKWTSHLLHVIVGDYGLANTMVEIWVALPGKDWDLLISEAVTVLGADWTTSFNTQTNGAYGNVSSIISGGACTFGVGTSTITRAAHEFSRVGTQVRFTVTGGSLPTLSGGGSLTGSTYYVVGTPTANTFSVSDTRGGAAVSFASAGSGTIVARRPLLFSGCWLLTFDTDRDPDSNHHAGPQIDTAMYYGEFLASAGAKGIPAPGFWAPPASKYTNATFYPTAPGRVVQLGQAENGRPTLNSAIVVPAINPGGQSVDDQGVHVEPGNWLKIFVPWCGLNFDYEHGQMWLEGGSGHSAGKNSGNYCFDLQGTNTMPWGWDFVDGPTNNFTVLATSNPLYQPDFYAPTGEGDNVVRWSAVHSYSMQLITPDGRHWNFGGPSSRGSASIYCLRSWNPVTNLYQAFPRTGWSNQDADYSNYLYHDPWTDKILVYQGASGSYGVFNYHSDQWEGSLGSTSQQASAGGGYLSSAYDPVNRRMFMVGVHSVPLRVFTVTTTGASLPLSLTSASLTFSGADAAIMAAADTASGGFRGPAVCYDPDLGCFWVWDADLTNNTTAGRNRVYRLDWYNTLTPPNSNLTTNLNVTTFNLDTSVVAINAGLGTSDITGLPAGGSHKMGVVKSKVMGGVSYGWLLMMNAQADAPYLVCKPT